MPNAPPRTCRRCGRVVRTGAGRCQRCTTHAEQARGSSTARGYTADWSAYSKQWLARFPWCGMRQDGKQHSAHSRCSAHGQRVRATVTDHIVAMKFGGAQLDPSNHQSLCAGCNARKAIALEGGFGR